MKNEKKQTCKLVAGLFTVMLVLTAAVTEACTIFAAAGSMVQGGGTLVGKTNDTKYEYAYNVKDKTNKGYPYFIVVPGELETKVTHGFYGTNKYGLTVVSAGGPKLITFEERKKIPFNGGLEKVLATCRTVDEALTHTECFWRPDFFILADKQEIACIEIGLNRQFKITRKKDGILVHTNHYLDTSLMGDKAAAGDKDSVRRYNRIRELLISVGRPLTEEDFKDFLDDDIIFRDGEAPETVETTGMMVARIKPDGDFNLYFKHKPDIDEEEFEVIEGSKEDIFEN